MNLNKLKNKLFRRPGQRVVIAVPYIWLLVLFLIPFAIVLKISFAEQEIAIPPFTPLTSIDEDLGRLNITISYQNYADIFQNFWHTLNPFGDSENSNIYGFELVGKQQKRKHRPFFWAVSESVIIYADPSG